jgi:hypothetical protein
MSVSSNGRVFPTWWIRVIPITTIGIVPIDEEREKKYIFR